MRPIMRVEWPPKVANPAETWAAKGEIFHIHFSYDRSAGVEQASNKRRVKVRGIAIHEMAAQRQGDPGNTDMVFETNGLKVVCDLKSWLYLKNVTVDYSDDMLTGGFKIKNPNAERTCGCGTSFSA